MSDTISTLQRVLAALAILGEATPAAIAGQAGLGYSTVPPKLRSLEADGLAERTVDSSGKTLWKLTPRGGLAATVAPAVGTTEQLTTESSRPHDVGFDDICSVPAGDDRRRCDEQPTNTAAGANAQPAASTEARPKSPTASSAAAEPQQERAVTEPDNTAENLAGRKPDAGASTPHADGAGTADSTEPAAGDGATTNTRTGHANVDPVGAIESTAQTTGEAPADGRMAGPYGQDDATGSDPADPAATGQQPEQAANAAMTPVGDDAGTNEKKRPRRRGGSLRDAVLKVLQDDPDQRLRVGQVCKAIDAANTDPTAAKASAGAVNNALLKLLNDGTIQRVDEKPATYQAI